MTRSTVTDLRALRRAGSGRARPSATAEEVLQWGAETFGDRMIVASNMQDAVLVDLAAKAAPGVDVLFLETGYHFPETIGTRDAVAAMYDMKIVNAPPEHTVAEQDTLLGRTCSRANRTSAAACARSCRCGAPWRGYDAWVTGVRRVEAPTRANTPLITYDEKTSSSSSTRSPRGATRRWTPTSPSTRAGEPAGRRGLPVDRLPPCTVKPLPGADPRTGRWAGHRQDRMRPARMSTARMTRTITPRPTRRARRPESPSRSTSSARSPASSTAR